MTMTNEEVLRAVLLSWSQGHDAIAEAFREHFTSDCVFEQVGVPTTTGPEEAVELFRGLGQLGLRGIDVDYRNVVSAGDIVCSERVDHMVKADGSIVASSAVVGVTEFRGGKISSWREYYDPSVLAAVGFA